MHFSNGRSWTLRAVNQRSLEWSDDRGRRWRAGREAFLPELDLTSGDLHLRREISGNVEAIWPLTVGKTVYYRVISQQLDAHGRLLDRSLADWRCRVDQPRRLELLAGVFRTLPLVCDRSSELGRFRQRQTWFYSDNPGVPVSMLDQRPGREDRGWQLLAYVPALGLGDSAQQELADQFQQTMERVPSGETRNWQDADGKRRVRITPLATLRQREGIYCRQYQLRIKQPNAETRWGAGIVCRDKDRRWKIPQRIDDGRVRFSVGGEPT